MPHVPFDAIIRGFTELVGSFDSRDRDGHAFAQVEAPLLASVEQLDKFIIIHGPSRPESRDSSLTWETATRSVTELRFTEDNFFFSFLRKIYCQIGLPRFFSRDSAVANIIIITHNNAHN